MSIQTILGVVRRSYIKTIFALQRINVSHIANYLRGHWRTSSRRSREVALANPTSLKLRRDEGGWGGIRTHEALRPGGFQDRSFRPLTHPSGTPFVP